MRLSTHFWRSCDDDGDNDGNNDDDKGDSSDDSNNNNDDDKDCDEDCDVDGDIFILIAFRAKFTTLVLSWPWRFKPIPTVKKSGWPP